MAAFCCLCAGPIDPQDTHEHCVACLGLAHAEAAFGESDCAHCADLSARVLRTRRNVARGLFGSRPTAAKGPLVGPPMPRGGGDDDPAQGRRPLPSPRSPVTFTEESLRPSPAVADAISFGLDEEDDDSMSISASVKDWAESERDRADSESTPDLQEFVRVLEKAVKELDLSWSAPEEPAKSKLDSWYFQAGRCQAALKRSTPFFPDVHKHVVRSWKAPQSARVHAATQAGSYLATF